MAHWVSLWLKPCLNPAVVDSLINSAFIAFDTEGNETPDMLVVRQAIRQDIRATMTQPLHALDWVGIALSRCKLRLGISGQTTAQILATLERVTQLYEDGVDIQAFELQPVAKRARLGSKEGRRSTEASGRD